MLNVNCISIRIIKHNRIPSHNIIRTKPGMRFWIHIPSMNRSWIIQPKLRCIVVSGAFDFIYLLLRVKPIPIIRTIITPPRLHHSKPVIIIRTYHVCGKAVVERV